MTIRTILAGALLLAAAVQPALVPPASAQAPRSILAEVQARGALVCGVNGELPGFSAPDAAGAMQGFDADLCRAVAAATLGNAEAVRFVPIPTPDAGFAALGEGRIDLLARNTTLTYFREVAQPVASAGIVLFDGQGLLVRRDSGIASARHLDGKRVCVTGIAGTTGAEVVEAAAARLGIAVTIVSAGGGRDLLAALAAGRCEAASTDYTQLAVRRVTELPDPDAYEVLRELLSREPLALLVREGDEGWRQTVFWTLQAMLEADEFGIGRANLLQAVQSNDPAVRRLVGVETGLGAPLRLDESWTQRVITQVGSYGEVFERHLGRGSRFGLDRALNDNWQRGGLMFPMPLR
jgi:general L-amino acid transport system substrate-binding protein